MVALSEVGRGERTRELVEASPRGQHLALALLVFLFAYWCLQGQENPVPHMSTVHNILSQHTGLSP